VVTRLGCVRGIATLTAFGLAIENGDWHRLDGRTIGAYLGFVPTENSSEQPAPRAGSRRPAMVMLAGCWSRRPGITAHRIGPELISEALGSASPTARARGQAANRRLHARWVRFDERKKRSITANAAIARELAGWCWSLAVLDD